MGDIRIKDSAGNELYKITTDSAGAVTKVDAGTDASKADISVNQMNDILKGTQLGADGATWTLDKLLSKLGEASVAVKDGKVDKAEVEKVGKRLEALNDALGLLKDKLSAAKAATPPNADLVNKLEALVKNAESQLKQLHNELKANEGKEGFPQSVKDQMKSIATKHGLADAASPSSGKASMSSGGAAGSAQQAAPQQTYPTNTGKAQNGQGGFPGTNGFDFNSWMQSNMIGKANLGAMDQIGQSQMQQKKMMMLFMYFAMMAMSGDIGAMAAFMQFITTIISKDKAMQSVNMANKLIELQDASRKATDELLNTPSYDKNNPQIANDFAKTMEKVKADQGSIATSQKIIAQMMEEFAQVSEFLNNMQKSLLDVRGRIMSRVSSFNA